MPGGIITAVIYIYKKKNPPPPMGEIEGRSMASEIWKKRVLVTDKYLVEKYNDASNIFGRSRIV